MTPENFPELVEQARLQSLGMIARSKAILQRLLPAIDALQQERNNFSPRLMQVMQARAAGQLSPADDERFANILVHAEVFQDALVSFMRAVEQGPADQIRENDAAICRDNIQIQSRFIADLDRILATLENGSPSTT